MGGVNKICIKWFQLFYCYFPCFVPLELLNVRPLIPMSLKVKAKILSRTPCDLSSQSPGILFSSPLLNPTLASYPGLRFFDFFLFPLVRPLCYQLSAWLSTAFSSIPLGLVSMAFYMTGFPGHHLNKGSSLLNLSTPRLPNLPNFSS